MAIELATGYVTVVPSARGFGRDLSRQVSGVGTSVGSRLGVDLGSSMSRGSASGIDGIGSRIASMASGAGRALGTIATTGTLLLGGLAVAGGAWGLSTAAQAEQAEIAFTTMLGSGERAQAFLEELRGFAATTPFEFPELQTAASSLISAGIEADKVIPIMTTLGDVTSGMGTGSEGVQRATVALQQMAAAGRITGEDLNQLRDAGIPVFDLLAAATGKSKEEVAELAQAGKLGAEELGQLMSALESGQGLERFSGLMEQQSQSLSGLVSTMKDTLGQGLADALAPVIPQIKMLLPGITEVLGGLAGTLGTAVSSILPVLLPVITTLLDAVGPVIESLAGAFADLVPAVAPIIESLAGALAPVVESMAPVFGLLGTAAEALAPIIDVLAESLGPVLGPILDGLAAGLTPIVEALGGGLLTAVEAIAPLLPELAQAFGDLMGAVGAELGAALTEIFAALMQDPQTMSTLVLSLVDLAAAFVPLLPILVQLIAPILRFQTAIGGYLARAITWVAQTLTTLLGPALTAIGWLVTNVVTPAVSWLVTAAQTGFGWIATAATWMWQNALLPVFSAIGSFVTGTVIPAVQRLWTAAQPVFSAVAGAVSSMWSRVSGVFASFVAGISSLRDTIAEKIDAAVALFSAVAGRIGDAFSGVADAIKAPFIAAFGAIRGLWNSTVGGFSFSIPSWVPGGIGGKSFAIPSMHTGGVVPGGASAEVLRLLQGGEVVLSRDNVAALHRGLDAPAGALPTEIPVYIDGREVARAIYRPLAKMADQDRRGAA